MSSYTTAELEGGQCPECGDRARITETKAEEDIRPVPASLRAHCNECGYSGDPLAFRHEYEWDEMSSTERAQAKEASERAADRMAAWQESAAGIAERRNGL